MKKIFLISCILLTGCASANYTAYVDAHKATSKDLTMAEIACYNSVTEAIKAGDNTMKTAAVALLAQCKKSAKPIEAPKKNWLGF